MYIYKTVNKVNGKAYIGKYGGKKSTYIGSGVALKKAIAKYGVENFSREILEECSTLQELAEREKFWIGKFNAINSKDYYNMKEGGTGGFDHITSEHYTKRSNVRYGKKLTPPPNAILSRYIQEYKVSVDGETHIISGMNNVQKFLNMERSQIYVYLNHEGPLQGYKYNSLEVCYHTEISYLIEGREYNSTEEILTDYPDLKISTLSARLLNSKRWDWWKIKRVIQ